MAMPTGKKGNSKKNVSLSAHAKTSTKQSTSKKASKNANTLFYAIVVVVLLALLAIVMVQRKNATVRQMTGIESVKELNDKLGIELVVPTDAKDVKFAVRGDSIGVVEYDKTGKNGDTIHYILSYSKNPSDKIEYFRSESWSTPIEMNVDTRDGKTILVTSNVSSEDRKKMQGKWTDNEVFYVMATETLTSREDFLQEVNRLVINNHKKSD